MHPTAIICSVLAISAITASAHEYNVNITFQKAENCEIDCLQILLKFNKGENFTEKEKVDLDKTITGNIHNFDDIIGALQQLVNHTHDDDAHSSTNSILSSTTTKSNEHIKTQGTRTSNETSSSVPTKSSSSKLSEAATSTGKQAETSTETTTPKFATLPTIHKDLEKPSKRSHEATAGVLITLTVVIIIIAGGWFGRKYYRTGTSESYFLLR